MKRSVRFTLFAVGALAVTGASAPAQPPAELSPADRERIAGQLRGWRLSMPDGPLGGILKSLAQNPEALRRVEQIARSGQAPRGFPPGGLPGRGPEFSRSPGPPPQIPGLADLPKLLGPDGAPPDAAPAVPEQFSPRPADEPVAEDQPERQRRWERRRHSAPGADDGPMPGEIDPQKAERLAVAMSALESFVGPSADVPALQTLVAQLVAGESSLDPAWTDSLAKLAEGAARRGSGGDLGLGDTFDPKLFEGWEAPKLDLSWKDWKLPALGNWSLGSPPPLGSPRLGSGGMGDFGTPSFGAPSAPPFGLLVLIAAAVLFWLCRGRFSSFGVGLGLFAPPRPALPLPAPPIDWAGVRTRAQLIAAFEAATVRRLGPDAKCRNHRRLAADLAAAGVPGELAGPLSQSYALARYAPESDALPEPLFAAARKQLRDLDGAPA